MAMDMIRLGQLSVSKFIIGGNPFSGFSHQSPDRDLEMKRYYTTSRIKQTLKGAEQLGINTHIGRADHHIMRLLLEYWYEGGTIQWIAQTCPELGTIERGVENAIKGRAKACFIHGGQMDYLLAQDRLDEVPAAIAKIKDAGIPAGIAGHNPKVLTWAEQNLEVDFYMCPYYNPAHRDKQAEHIPGMQERFKSEDRDIMVQVIQTLSKPAIHYKVLAAGRDDPKEAFAFVARHLRPQDAVCVGIYTKDKPEMLEENLHLLRSSLREASE